MRNRGASPGLREGHATDQRKGDLRPPSPAASFSLAPIMPPVSQAGSRLESGPATPSPTVVFSAWRPDFRQLPDPASSRLQGQHHALHGPGPAPHLSEPPPLTHSVSLWGGGPAGEQRQVWGEAGPGEVAAGQAGIWFDGAGPKPVKVRFMFPSVVCAVSVEAGRRREGKAAEAGDAEAAPGGGFCRGLRPAAGGLGNSEMWGGGGGAGPHPPLARILKVGRDTR